MTTSTYAVPGQSTRGTRSIDVEQLLVWAYCDQLVGGAFTAPGMSEEAPKRGGIGRFYSAPGSDDAMSIEAAVNRLDPYRAGLVRLHARTGTRPEWYPSPRFRIEPMRHANGAPIVRYWDSDYRQPKLCEIVARDRPDTVALARDAYGHWHAALNFVRGALMLGGQLREYRATGPIAPARPWETGDSPAPWA